MPAGGRNDRDRAASAANLSFVLMATALFGSALAANHGWTDRHFLPTFAFDRARQLRIVDALRLVVAILGVLLLLVVRPRFVRAVRSRGARAVMVSTLTVVLAVVAAFGATEAILHTKTWRATQERWGVEQPRRIRDREVGWTFRPNHIGTKPISGRLVTYTIDRFGYRVRAIGDPFDVDSPTILLAGESILLGYGLQWPETIDARLRARTGLQVANLSVNAFASDQISLRLRRELPRFRRPVAVVIPFVPMLFDRDLDRDRPHLDENLRWHPGRPPSWRLVELVRRVLRYRSEESIAAGVLMAQRALRADIALVRSHGARPIIIVPEYVPEEPTERAVRERVLDAAHIPYVLVRLQPGWRLAEDRHPDPRGAREIADAVARALSAGQGTISPAESRLLTRGEAETERVGFEPTVGVNPRRFSRPLP